MIHGPINCCRRKIKLITPVRIADNSSYCYVYTFQEKFEWGDYNWDRSNERMIAFGAVAELLQLVDYVNNEVGLNYYYDEENYQNVISGFSEWDPRKYFWGNAGSLPINVREFEANDCWADFWREPVKGPARVIKYNANAFEYVSGRKSYSIFGNNRIYEASEKQFADFVNAQKKGTYVEYEQVEQYVDYKLYHYGITKKQ